MPDITMCRGNNCPLKEQCFRFTSKPNKHRQSFFTIPPYDKETKDCEYFWQVDPIKTQKTTTNELE